MSAAETAPGPQTFAPPPDNAYGVCPACGALVLRGQWYVLDGEGCALHLDCALAQAKTDREKGVRQSDGNPKRP